MKDSARHKALEIATVALFAVSLVVPSLGLIAGLRHATSALENRVLAGFPELPRTVSDVARFAAEFDEYASDRLLGRSFLFRTYSRLRVAAFQRSPTDKVLLGRDGWLFWAGDRAVDQFRGAERFTPEELEHWSRMFDQRRRWLEARGIEYRFIVAPNKHSIYPEFIPDSVYRVRSDSRLDQWLASLSPQHGSTILDLRPALVREKGNRTLYYRTDSHWNADGAYVAQAAIFSALGMVPPLRVGDLERVVRDGPGFGLAGHLGLRDRFPDRDIELRVRAPRSTALAPPRVDSSRFAYPPEARGTNDPRQLRAVVFQDSFGNALRPYLDEAFQRVVYAWSYDVDPVLIEAESPDLVIHEVVERFLHRRPRSLGEVRDRVRRQAGAETDLPGPRGGR